ncbi:3-deoxy-7-phosphoheptulonate synthase [Capsulimonas corticalis]|uniref:3-deoxy-7-phosphoheptulonate synthase n=1 Tax=Capsulimonas corticalis TaxID=2219043 RepID=A0A402D4B4_9BACT|nr:3-deoxy-7-phosphoheptulonate synthase [Capsulimonas corticalis]BDI31153.1 3-deoxy-7-phosphoheptulonate synthase [Capsulimonas corticalis]
MIVIMQADATKEQIGEVEGALQEWGYEIHPIYGVERTVIAAVGAPTQDEARVAEQVESLPSVERAVLILKPYRFASKEFRPEKSQVKVGDVVIGDNSFVMMAGPCTVESEEQLMTAARAVKAGGATVLRGGAFKPSTSPYSFQGMGEDGLKLLAQAREETGLPIITEVMHVGNIDLVCKYADILQIGTRNMQNYDLLIEVGKVKKPVMLKRGMSAKIEEWLQAAEYIIKGGNDAVMLCERGVRTSETYTRNTLDLSAVLAVRELSHLPVIIDPSQGTGRSSMVPAMCKAAAAVGADGVLVEVHPNPEKALKDGAQSITIPAFEKLMPELRAVVEAVGRYM